MMRRGRIPHAVRPLRPIRPVRSVRARIIGWVLALATIGTLATAFTAYSLQLERVETRTDNAIAQEVREFSDFLTSRGTPWTSRDFPTLVNLFEAAERGNVGGRFEAFTGLIGTDMVTETGRPIGLGTRADLLEEFADLPADGDVLYGSTLIEGTEVRYAAIPVSISGVEETGTYVITNDLGAQRDEAVTAAVVSAGVAFVGLVLLAAVGWWLSGRLLRPVRLLRDAITQVSDADFSRRIPVRGRDDISMLAETFNGMVDELEDAFSSQRRFLDDASHELRTPIAILRGHLELLDLDDPERSRRTVVMLIDELDRMRRLVDDITLLAAAARPDFVTDQPIEADRFIDEIADKARPLGRRRWTVESRIEATFAGDKQRLTQALLQLADNAVKFTSDGDEIAFGVAHGDGTLRLWVRDTGQGIDPADAARIFERFARARSGRTTEGSGLGLSIVTAIAESHGGRVGLTSAPGTGSVFTIELPGDRLDRRPAPHGTPFIAGVLP